MHLVSSFQKHGLNRKKAETIRVILDGSSTGYENMAKDEALLLLSASLDTPVLRLYNFHPPCISIGRSQQYPGELNVEKCAEKGIDIVRRPTGGLSILHMNDFTYCVVLPAQKKDSRFDLASFALVSRGIVRALSILGIKAEVAVRKMKYEKGYQWCFQSVFGIDIEWKGNKICGSAQRVGKNGILQHGTMIISRPDISFADLTLRNKITGSPRSSGENYFVTLEESGIPNCDYYSISKAFILGFQEVLKVEALLDHFRPDEIELSEELTAGKYMNESWLKYGHF